MNRTGVPNSRLRRIRCYRIDEVGCLMQPIRVVPREIMTLSSLMLWGEGVFYLVLLAALIEHRYEHAMGWQRKTE